MKKGLRKFSFKNLLPHSLFGRSLLILIMPLFLVQIITVYAFFDRHWQKMADRLAYAVAGEIAFIVTQVEGDDTPRAIQNTTSHIESSLDLAMTYEGGKTLESVFNKKHARDPGRESQIALTLSRALNQQVRRPFDITVDSGAEKWVQVRLQLTDGVLTVTLPQRRLFSSSGYVVLLWMIGSSIILLAIAVLFMRNQIKPIRRLAIAAERFGKGRDVPFFKVEGAREVRQASRAFLDMRERLRRQMQQRTAMLAGVSHDLRTPLTRMKLQLEMMPSSQDTKDLKTDLQDMEWMIEAYLQFARGEGNELPRLVDLSDLLAHITAQTNREKQVLFLDAEKDLSLSLRPLSFERCLNNLIGNALKYGGTCWLSAKRVDDMIEICIDDDGPGIPADQHDDVFKPFFRGESSRNSKTGGVGLGLPIAQDIVLSHGGQIWLDKSPQGGLRVLIDLPV